MGNEQTASCSQKITTPPDGNLTLSGWFRWDGQLFSEPWTLSLILHKGTVFGQQDAFVGDKQTPLSKTYSGTWKDEKINILVSYGDGSLGRYTGTYFENEPNSYSAEISVTMETLGLLAKKHWASKNGRGGGLYTIVPAPSIQFDSQDCRCFLEDFLQISDFELTWYLLCSLPQIDLNSLRLSSTWLNEFISAKNPPSKTNPELRVLEYNLLGYYQNKAETKFLCLFDSHYEFQSLTGSDSCLDTPEIGTWRRINHPARKELKSDYKLQNQVDIITLNSFSSMSFSESTKPFLLSHTKVLGVLSAAFDQLEQLYFVSMNDFHSSIECRKQRIIEAQERDRERELRELG